MWKHTILVLFLVGIIAPQFCHSNWLEAVLCPACLLLRQSSTDLRFEAGDIIHCKINPVAGHVMLAVSNSQVIHMVGDQSSRKGRIVKQGLPNYGACRIENVGVRHDAVQRAEADYHRYGNRVIHYDILDCNCEHWVNYWAFGGRITPQNLLPMSSECDVGKSDDGQTGRGGMKTVVWLYEHRDYQGASKRMELHVGECQSFFHGDWWNDRTSSVKVEGQGCVVYFTDAHCEGNSYRLTGYEAYVGDRYNDKISSVRPCLMENI